MSPVPGSRKGGGAIGVRFSGLAARAMRCRPFRQRREGFFASRHGRGTSALFRAELDSKVSIPGAFALPMNSLDLAVAVADRSQMVSGFGGQDGQTFPWPRAPRTGARGVGCSALSIVAGPSRRRRPRWSDLWARQRSQLESHRRGFSFQRLQHVGRHLRLVLLHRLGHVLFAVLEHPVDQTRQLVRGRLDCSSSTDPTADPAVEQAQRRHCPAHDACRQPQGDGYPVRRLAMREPSLRPVALILRRTQPEPAREVFLSRKATDVHADFGQNHQGRSYVDPLDQGQIHAQSLEQRAIGIEPNVVALFPTLARLSGLSLLSARSENFASSASTCTSHSVIC